MATILVPSLSERFDFLASLGHPSVVSVPGGQDIVLSQAEQFAAF